MPERQIYGQVYSSYASALETWILVRDFCEAGL